MFNNNSSLTKHLVKSVNQKMGVNNLQKKPMQLGSFRYMSNIIILKFGQIRPAGFGRN